MYIGLLLGPEVIASACPEAARWRSRKSDLRKPHRPTRAAILYMYTICTQMNMYIYIYIYLSLSLYTHIYIYIYNRRV